MAEQDSNLDFNHDADSHGPSPNDDGPVILDSVLAYAVYGICSGNTQSAIASHFSGSAIRTL